MPKRAESILLTGGAGFIGSRLARALASGYADDVWVFDNLHPQVHGANAALPSFPPNVRFVRGDVCDRSALTRCVLESDPEIVVHLAAETGTGQSMDEPVRYTEVNVLGTAHLIEALRENARRLRRFVLPSSRAVYGEGPYRRPDGGVVVPPARDGEAMSQGRFEPHGDDGAPLTGLPAHEDTPVAPCSVYASSKLMQEFLLLQAGGIDWTRVILRFQNVYGPGQSLRNPYTGVLSIFARQILDGRRLNIFEDGAIVRDFVFVDDVVDALLRACRVDLPTGSVINIGSGRPTTILEAARILLRCLGSTDDGFEITGDFRPGDIRHAVADIQRAKDLLGWAPSVSLEDGLERLAKSV